MHPHDDTKSLNIITLGCSKNSVDSEYLAGHLQAAGFNVSHEGTEDFYDAVIINTCGFIQDAKEESIDTILHHARRKQNGKLGKLIVMGCLAQRYKSELQAELSEADAIFGINQTEEILQFLKPQEYKPFLDETRILSTPAHFAWLKVSEGCDRQCSFCAIPMIRGKHISKPLTSLLKEAQSLVLNGSKELILIAQDLTSYGKDLKPKQNVESLLENLIEIPGDFWIRLHYAYPNGISDELMSLITKNDKVCNYLDVPFQHISDRILKSMRRGHREVDIRTLMDKIRQQYPALAVRTTFIVGYPGETDTEFQALLQFIEDYRFERLGAFSYSHEEDTPAYKMKDSVPQDVKEERLAALMELQEGISSKKNQQQVGSVIQVLIDEALPDGSFIGRSQHDSPEIDNEVIIQANKQLRVGDFAWVKVMAAGAYDLEAVKISTFDH